MRTFLLLASLLLLLGGGCGGSESGSNGAADSARPREAQDTRDAEVYAAVIRRLVTHDHTFGSADPSFKVIYVLDGAVPGAADPEEPDTKKAPRHPFSEATKTAIRAEVTDLPPVRFVHSRSTVVEGTSGGESPGRVANGGALVTLGPIDGEGASVEVESSLWINGLAGTWLTYVVALQEREWRVAGTRGPVAIS